MQGDTSMPGNSRQSRKDSQITNDPLYLDGFANVGEHRYSQLSGSLKFNVSFAGLMPLIDEVYAQLCIAEEAFARSVPLSAFSYYIILQLWGRIAALRQHKNMTLELMELLDHLTRKQYPVPEPIAQYFRGIGDVIDSTGVRYSVNLTVQPTVVRHGPSSGWAGRITEKTHNIYESIPMPGVAAARLCADAAAGWIPANYVGPWQVPDSIRPMVGDKFIGGYPTVNLLGYRSAIPITMDQVHMLCEFGITPDNAAVDGPFALNIDLLSWVSICLKNADKSFKMDKKGFRNSTLGSQALMGFAVRATNDGNIASPNSYYSNNKISAQCSVNQDSRFIMAAKVFIYRIRRDTFPADVNQWSCFHFNNYREVPTSWVENRNELFEDVLLWNTARVGTTFTEVDSLRSHFVRDAVINKLPRKW